MNTKSIKRKTVTLSSDFYNKIRTLPSEIKHQVIDTVLDLFFEGTTINYSNYDITTQTALSCLVPDLRRVQTQFDNGRAEKKSSQYSKGLFCPNETSQIKPTEANYPGADSSFLNNNNIYNIYNNQITSNQDFKKEELHTDTEKKEFFATAVLEQLERIGSINTQVYQKIKNVINTIAGATEPLKIRNALVLPEEFLEVFLDIFRAENEQLIVERLANTIARVENVKTTNRFNYLISSLYCEAKYNL